MIVLKLIIWDGCRFQLSIIYAKMNESNTPCSLYQNINTHSIQINGNCCITFVIFTWILYILLLFLRSTLATLPLHGSIPLYHYYTSPSFHWIPSRIPRSLSHSTPISHRWQLAHPCSISASPVEDHQQWNQPKNAICTGVIVDYRQMTSPGCCFGRRFPRAPQFYLHYVVDCPLAIHCQWQLPLKIVVVVQRQRRSPLLNIPPSPVFVLLQLPSC